MSMPRKMRGHFAPQQCTTAMKACNLLHTLWFPLVHDVKVGMQVGIDNCPVMIQDINVAKMIFGKDVCLSQGKSVQKQPPAVLSTCVAAPQQTRQLHNKIALLVDAFFIQKILIVTALSKKIKFQTTALMNNCKSTSFVEVLERIFAACNKREFTVVEIHGDLEFEVLDPWLDDRGITFNATSKGNVPEIEWQICFNKEKWRCKLA